jgi:hypothetical protein
VEVEEELEEAEEAEEEEEEEEEWQVSWYKEIDRQADMHTTFETKTEWLSIEPAALPQSDGTPIIRPPTTPQTRTGTTTTTTTQPEQEKRKGKRETQLNQIQILTPSQVPGPETTHRTSTWSTHPSDSIKTLLLSSPNLDMALLSWIEHTHIHRGKEREREKEQKSSEPRWKFEHAWTEMRCVLVIHA